MIALGLDNGSVTVWDLQRGIVCNKLTSTDKLPAVTDVCFSTDGQNIYTCSMDEDILEWNIQVLSQLF